MCCHKAVICNCSFLIDKMFMTIEICMCIEVAFAAKIMSKFGFKIYCFFK